MTSKNIIVTILSTAAISVAVTALTYTAVYKSNPTPTVTVTATPSTNTVVETNPDCIAALDAADKLITASAIVTTEVGNHFMDDSKVFANIGSASAVDTYLERVNETTAIIGEQAEAITGVGAAYDQLSKSCRS